MYSIPMRKSAIPPKMVLISGYVPKKTKADYERIVDLYKAIDDEEDKIKRTKKHIKSIEKVKYVKRDAVKKIIAAWVITVPASAVLSAAIFFMIRGIVL